MKKFNTKEIQNFPPLTGIYSISFKKKEKRYIGSAARNNGKNNADNGFYCRWRKHIHLLRNNKHHSIALQNAFNKYGEENLVFTILKFCTPSECLTYEQNFINKFNSFKKGYNGRPLASNNKNIKWSNSRLLKHKNKFKIIRNNHFKFIAELYEQNKSMREISLILKLSRNYIKRVLKENKIKSKTIGYTRRIPILQYDLNNRFLKKWNSISECATVLTINNASIRMVLNGKSKQTKNFIFKYA